MKPRKPGKFITKVCEHCDGSGRVVNYEWLRWQREQSGKSGREFAKEIGFSAVYVSDIERGKRNCTQEILNKYEDLEARKK